MFEEIAAFFEETPTSTCDAVFEESIEGRFSFEDNACMRSVFRTSSYGH
jgi:hypothetical protein